ncbi:MAG TPA: META domain-containing protein [Pseudomonadota bacterium]|nr:META domain-containing protein [Xanthomonadales bacterium]HQX24975.1 META domain-containing protein [Pseudomonadota bacterium]HQY36288.1 META domain-containing protein [Pseudomonadota bacterium]HRA37135.1 META domain-containing protein [Pseudomonadota bacterium]
MPGLQLRAVVAIVAVSVAACAPPATEQPPAPTAAPAAATTPAPAAVAAIDLATGLVAYRWQLRTATDAGGQSLAALFPSAERPLGLGFADGRVNVEGACNRMGASYQLLEGGKIQVGQAMSTMMACPPPLDRVDAAVAAVLAGTLQAAIDGTAEAPTLRLVAADGSILQLAGEPTPETRFGGPGTIAFLEVAAQSGPCEVSPASERRCLMVRERHFDADGLATGTPGEFRPLPEGIEGYTPTEGQRQVLRVKRFQREAAAGGEPEVHFVLDLVIETEIVAP